MKIVLFASLFAAVELSSADLDSFYQLDTNAVDKTYDMPLSKNYKEEFSIKYSSTMSVRLLKRVAENYGHLSYGDGKEDVIESCGALPNLKDCFRRMEEELGGIAESVAAKLIEKYEMFLDQYGRLALAVIEAYERLDAPGETVDSAVAVAAILRDKPFAHVTFAVAGREIVCVLEFLNNAKADVDRVFRKYDLYADRSPAKEVMTAEELKRTITISLTTTVDEHKTAAPESSAAANDQEMIDAESTAMEADKQTIDVHWLTNTSDQNMSGSESSATGSGQSDLKRFEEARDRLREFEKTIEKDGESFCEEPEHVRLNEGSLKWSVIREWEDFDKEFYKGVTLSDHKAFVDNQGISLNDIYGHFSTMPTSWKEMMMANQLVPFILNNFFSKLTLYVHLLALQVSKKFSELPDINDREYVERTFLAFESLVDLFRISVTFLYDVMKFNENIIHNLNILCDFYGDPVDVKAKFENKVTTHKNIKNRIKECYSIDENETTEIANQNINVEQVRDDFEATNMKLIDLTDKIKRKLGK